MFAAKRSLLRSAEKSDRRGLVKRFGLLRRKYVCEDTNRYRTIWRLA